MTGDEVRKQTPKLKDEMIFNHEIHERHECSTDRRAPAGNFTAGNAHDKNRNSNDEKRNAEF